MKGFMGEAYFACSWENLNGAKGVHYVSDSEGMKMYEELNPDCRKAFSFMFCWRGVWEGRIYFPNESEYWSEELKIMADLWEKLLPHLKQKILDANPDYKYFDE